MKSAGLVQIYTGDGKGKTTAALGLSLRAAGYGRRVLIYQFLKPPSLKTGERSAISGANLPIEIRSLDFDWNMLNSPKSKSAKNEVRRLISEALSDLTKIALAKTYDMLVLDEICFCLSLKLATIDQLKSLIAAKHHDMELILTGRDASSELIELADLVTEMKKIKHPFDMGIMARESIEF